MTAIETQAVSVAVAAIASTALGAAVDTSKGRFARARQ